MTLENLSKYRPAALAGNYFHEKNPLAAKSALEKLALNLGEDGGELVEALKNSEEGNQILTGVFSKKHEKILGEHKPNELFEFYSSHFEKYLKKDSDSYNEAKNYFDSFKESYKDIKNEVIGAQELLGSRRTNITEEEKEGAKKTLEKYSKIFNLVEGIEKIEMNKLGTPVEEDSLGKYMQEAFKPKETPKTP